MTLEKAIEELSLQKEMIELVLEKNIELKAKVEALTEALIVHDILDSSELEVLEKEWYQDIMLDLISPTS